jgi:hypothetical protein
MRITRQAVLASRTCAICERTLLVGERSVRYSPDGESILDVCPLCQEVALDYGWLKEAARSRRSWPTRGAGAVGRWPRCCNRVGQLPSQWSTSHPRRLSRERGDGRGGGALQRQRLPRTVRDCEEPGDPQASIVPLSGTNSEVVVTVAWDISWYQYRIAPESGQPVRLAERGHDPRELDPMFIGWNARLTPDGRIVPEISPV